MRFVAITLGLYVLLCLLIYLQQERLIFFPEALPAGYAFGFAQPFEELTWQADGATLSALHFKADRPKGVVLFFHGNAGSLRDWGGIAGDWTSRGYDVVIPDYRGYGKSTGAIKDEATLHADALIAYDYVAARFPADQIILAGRSLGTGLASRLAATQRVPGPARMLILETPYASLREIAHGQFPWVPQRLMKYPLQTDQWIGRVACPVYLIHGSADELIPHASSERLLALTAAPARLFTIAGGRHNDYAGFPAYGQALDEILR